LTPNKEKHFPTITDPKEIGQLLRAIDTLTGNAIAQNALLFLALTFVRPGELRTAEWVDIDFEKAEWRIPAEKMETKRPHIVPLSRQAVAVLNRLKPLTGHGKYIFSSTRSLTKGDRPMSDGTMNAAIRRLDYTKEQFTPHGFSVYGFNCLERVRLAARRYRKAVGTRRKK